jgi:DNA-binding transcriptional regulator GbsR (MarR family)
MHDAAKAFIEHMGLQGEDQGFSRTAGRMLGFFMIHAQPHTLDGIAEQLQVSKASVSTNARMLENQGLLERHSSPGDRRDFYRLSDCPWEQMFAVARRRMMRMLDLYGTTLAQLPAEMGEARERLETWRRFYAFMLDDLEGKAARWREELARQANGVKTA